MAEDRKISNKKYIIAGGGTGGHIFPAIAIADAFRKNNPACEILFVGAKGRMEMEKVPQAGYKIIGLDVVGIQRSLSIKNLFVPFKLLKSLIQAIKIIIDFKPNACIGVGGYASAPVIFMASIMGVDTYIQEQNSYPGISNKILSKFAKKIFVAYDNLHQFFNPTKIVLTGNPVRKDIATLLPARDIALTHFNLDKNKKTILVVGGSLGAKTINNAVEKNLHKIISNDIQLIWQTGKTYYEDIILNTKDVPQNQIKIHQFIKEMNLAYSCADVIISRAGALSISELCIVGKPCILVPSPNVTEDHQTKNAMALVNKNAAILIKDADAAAKLIDTSIELLNATNKQTELCNNIRNLAKTNAANEIVEEILK